MGKHFDARRAIRKRYHDRLEFGMDGLDLLMSEIAKHGLAVGELRGLFHVLIGRSIARSGGERISTGLTWRSTAELLKRARWDAEAVREIGLDPAILSPRDRQRFWFSAIANAQVESAEASASGDRLADKLKSIGYLVTSPPARSG